MDTYERLAEQMLRIMDAQRHLPPEPVSATIRGEMAVLRLLGQTGGGQNPGDIASALTMTTSRVAAVLNALEKKRQITRSCDPDDRRRTLVTLTDRGKAVCMARRAEAKAHLANMLRHLSEEDAQTFVRLIGQLSAYACKPPRPGDMDDC